MNPDWQSLSIQYDLSSTQIDQLDRLFLRLKKADDRNLTAVTSDRAIFHIHFLDSLSLLQFIETVAADSFVDIGSGAGFPGLPLAIALPHCKFILVEANKSKARFISSAINSVGIENATVYDGRAEDFGRGSRRGSFDIALARAVASLPAVLEYAIPLLRVGGLGILQRGARTHDDQTEALRTSELLNAELTAINSVQPYPGAKNLHVWIFTKVAKTPDRYPRRSGMPTKKPLGS